jgi:hypothetical protein
VRGGEAPPRIQVALPARSTRRSLPLKWLGAELSGRRKSVPVLLGRLGTICVTRSARSLVVSSAICRNFGLVASAKWAITAAPSAIAALVADGKMKVIASYYDLASGKVTLSGPNGGPASISSGSGLLDREYEAIPW